jgi:hypothetical protein
MSEQDDSYLDLLEDDLTEKAIEIEQLEKWIAAVPTEAIRRQYTIGFRLYEAWQADQDAIIHWLRSLEPQP